MSEVDKNEQNIYHRLKGKACVKTSKSEKDKYFMSPETIADIREGINQYRQGKTTKIKNADFEKLLGLKIIKS